jgi:predicted N-formylglutamate amidohydrolase
MHSFTPVFMDVGRPWHAGVLYNRDPRFAHLLMALLKREEGLVVGDNSICSHRKSQTSEARSPCR